MNPLIGLKTITLPLLIAVSFAYFGLSPTAKAFLPAPSPDGGYPGANTAEGINALHDVNTAVGINNTAVGANALTHDTTGYSNVAVGEAALASNTTGNFNMAIGTEALRDNNANFNLAIGFRVLFMNTTGNNLTGIGAAALRNNTTASFNTAIGADALRENTTGENSTAIGANALAQNTTGGQNTAIGSFALLSNTGGTGDHGSFNTAVGDQALASNTIGFGNTATGALALYRNVFGAYNTANGYQALAGNGVGTNNTAIGAFALSRPSKLSDGNTAIGFRALEKNFAGGGNTAIGAGALLSNTTGSSNTALGGGAGGNVVTANNVICIGFNVDGADVDDTCFIGNIRDVQTQNADAIPVLIDSVGQLGTASSSAKFKKEIKPMDKASEAILALKPVTFEYKSDKTDTPQFGLIAEEVAQVNPKLVVRDKNGEIYTVRYDAVNAMLLNEFLKARHQIDAQQKQIDALTAGLQKVNAQLEATKPASQVVNNP